jgi:hypothetical protein
VTDQVALQMEQQAPAVGELERRLRELAARTPTVASSAIEWTDDGHGWYTGRCSSLPDCYSRFHIQAFASRHELNAPRDTFLPSDWHGPTRTYDSLEEAKQWCEGRAVESARGLIATAGKLGLSVADALARLGA